VLTAGTRQANNGRVPIGLFAREWERTCSECGYTWRVPRSIARGGVRGPSGMGMSGVGARGSSQAVRSNPRSLSDLNAGIEARAELMEGLRVCAKCGADDFTQRPVPRR
jgi:hypothetical protein